MANARDEWGDVIDKKGCDTCAKRELVERISGSSEISGVRLQESNGKFG